MATLGYLRREAHRTFQIFQSNSTTWQSGKIFLRKQSSFVPKHVLILMKISRYQFERMRDPNVSERELRRKLTVGGADYDMILESHHKNKAMQHRIIEVLKSLNIEYKVMDRLNLVSANIEWADLVLPVGGDGTFLLSSNLIKDNVKPIMGINSDPATSKGHLMLSPKFLDNLPEIFERLRAGQFKYMLRSRIRTTLKGENISCIPFYMHEKGRVTSEERFFCAPGDPSDSTKNMPNEMRLPWLALNEVFIAESLSARTSILRIKADDDIYRRVRSSGLCVGTGTGSTSWYRAINSLNVQIVKDILTSANLNSNYTDKQIEDICCDFNRKLPYPAEDQRLSYAIRDLIVSDIRPLWHYMKPRGFCNKIQVQSQCYDAGLVLDGGIVVPFNTGTTAFLEIHPQDALRNIVMT